MIFNRKKKLKIGLMGLAAKPIPSAKGNLCAPNDLVFELAEGLQQRGHEVILFSGENSSGKIKKVTADFKTASDQYGKEHENPIGFTSRRIEYDLILATEAIKAYKKKQIDFIHSHDGRYSPYLFYQTETPVLYTIHGDMRLVANGYDFYRYKLLKQSNFGYTCMSTENIKFCKEYGLKSYGFVQNGIDITKFPFGNKERNGLLLVGRMIKGKNITEAIEIAEKLKMDITLVGGPGPSKEDKEYFALLEEKYFKKPFVHYLGYVPREDLFKYYQKAEVMLYPTKSEEGMPLVILEAMACGLPVVANNIGGIADIIQPTKNGLLIEDHDSHAAIAQKVSAAAHYHNDVVRKTIEDKFTIDHMVDAYLATYEKFLKR